MDAMTLTICVVFLVGLALALRFNFLALYPAILFAMISAAAHAAASGGGIGATVLTMALGAAAVQLGYLFGLVMRAAIASFGVSERKGNWPRGMLGGVPRIILRQEEPQIASQSMIRRPSAGTAATRGRRLAS
jgi:hypothetical protein